MELHRLCQKFKFACFFLEQICTLRSFDSEYAHCPQEGFKCFRYTGFWDIKSESSSKDFLNVVGYSKTDSHFLQMVQAFKGRKSYVYRT